MKIGPIVKDGSTIGWMFFCPGCKCGHSIQTETERGIYDSPDKKDGDTWTFNGDQERPTIQASVLVTSKTWVPPVNEHNREKWRREPWKQHQVDTRCHSFVTDGQIRFLSDCTHELAGTTVPIPDL